MAKSKGDPKSGGRVKGTPNKSTQDLFDICEKHNCNVFESMVILAVQEPDESKKFERLREIAQYLYPKRKAIEVSSEDDRGFVIKIEDYGSKK